MRGRSTIYFKRHSEASSVRTPLKSVEIQIYAEWGLKHGWSVTTITGRLRRDKPGASISHEAIYQWVNSKRPELKCYLPIAGKSRKRRRAGKSHRKLPQPAAPKKSIEVRPEIASYRQRIGDYELDAVLSCRGSKSALQVLIDRRCRKVFLSKVASLEAKEYAKTLCRRIRGDINIIHSITSDNGSEHAAFDSVNLCLISSGSFATLTVLLKGELSRIEIELSESSFQRELTSMISQMNTFNGSKTISTTIHLRF